MYFNDSGKVDFFLFQFKPGALKADDEEQFRRLTQDFFKDYQLKLSSPAKSKFAQCSPVTYH